jgi:hypothetical protein
VPSDATMLYGGSLVARGAASPFAIVAAGGGSSGGSQAPGAAGRFGAVTRTRPESVGSPCFVLTLTLTV